MVSPIYFIIIPLAAAFLTALINKAAASRFIGLLTSIVLTVMAWFWFSAGFKESVPVILGGIKAPMGIQLAMDSLGATLVLVVAASSFLVMLFSQSYISSGKSSNKYYSVVLLLITASFGIILTRDLFNLFVFYEILCISSYILVSYEQNKNALEASVKYLLIGSAGSAFMLIAIGLAYKLTGSLAMADIAAAMSGASGAYAIATVVLFLFGMGVEAAIFPVSAWLPDAHSSAPSSISALLSGFVIEISLVVMLRVLYFIYPAESLLTVLRYIALAGVLVGEFAAFGQKELKRTLAYSSMGQIGIMLFAFSLGTDAGIHAGLSHLVMHAGAKSALFLIAGYFIIRTGSRNTDDYRGLGRKMPFSGVLFVLATLSLIGVPPLFGFFTKFRILSAAAASGTSGSWLGIGVILLGTVLEAVYLFRVYRILFASVPQKEKDEKSKEMEWPAAAAVAAFVLLVVLGSLLIPMIPAGLAI